MIPIFFFPPDRVWANQTHQYLWAGKISKPEQILDRGGCIDKFQAQQILHFPT